MTFRTGQHGELYIKNDNFQTSGSMTKVGNVKDWNISFSQNIIDSTCLQDKDRTINKGPRSFTGGGTLLYYEELGNNDSNFNLLLQRFIYPASPSQSGSPNAADFGQSATAGPGYVRLRLGLAEAGANNDTEVFEFYALITGFQVSCSVGEIVTGQFTFDGHGPVLTDTF